MAAPRAIPQIIGASAAGGAAIAYGTTAEIGYEVGLTAESYYPGITQKFLDALGGFAPIPTIFPNFWNAVGYGVSKAVDWVTGNVLRPPDPAVFILYKR